MVSVAKDWHPEDIKAAVRKKRWTLKALALANGLAEATCRGCFLRPIPAANRAVAKVVGEPLHILWPQWFDADGNRIPSNSNEEHTGQNGRGHRQKQAAK